MSRDEMSANVRAPATWPFRFRSKPTIPPNNKLSINLNIAEVVVTSVSEIVFRKSLKRFISQFF